MPGRARRHMFVRLLICPGARQALRADVYGLAMRRQRALTPRVRAFPKTRVLLTDKFTWRNEKRLAIFRWQW